MYPTFVNFNFFMMVTLSIVDSEASQRLIVSTMVLALWLTGIPVTPRQAMVLCWAIEIGECLSIIFLLIASVGSSCVTECTGDEDHSGSNMFPEQCIKPASLFWV